jgi:hypothetical protein
LADCALLVAVMNGSSRRRWRVCGGINRGSRKNPSKRDRTAPRVALKEAAILAVVPLLSTAKQDASSASHPRQARRAHRKSWIAF